MKDLNFLYFHISSFRIYYYYYYYYYYYFVFLSAPDSQSNMRVLALNILRIFNDLFQDIYTG